MVRQCIRYTKKMDNIKWERLSKQGSNLIMTLPRLAISSLRHQAVWGGHLGAMLRNSELEGHREIIGNAQATLVSPWAAYVAFLEWSCWVRQRTESTAEGGMPRPLGACHHCQAYNAAATLVSHHFFSSSSAPHIPPLRPLLTAEIRKEMRNYLNRGSLLPCIGI
jgi:hypothetical protein